MAERQIFILKNKVRFFAALQERIVLVLTFLNFLIMFELIIGIVIGSVAHAWWTKDKN